PRRWPQGRRGEMTPGVALASLWVAWVVSWGLASVWTRRTQARPPFGEILLYSAPIAVGAWLLLFGVNATVAAGGGPFATRFAAQLWRLPDWAGWMVTAVAAAGFAFT